ncbi:GNAT family N-acetyltransferase [Pseudorhodobacter sp. W20_MBD10_FR17]|uniref:GNAT family N-acetyltransferase n=1 Tax=Pseudorhodobacter sp. W20_MBD10_FR17 TaxID=3240266 RepID=UPI003F956821
MDFDAQPTLIGRRLTLRPLAAEDQAALAAAAADPELWAGHPAKDRWRPDVFGLYFQKLLASGGTLAVIDTASGRVIGCSQYYRVEDAPGDISIGFTFLARDWWGGATNAELKQLMLDHAFQSFDRVWFHINPTNIRSQKATTKTGALFDHDATIGISGAVGAWKCYVLTREAWQS